MREGERGRERGEGERESVCMHDLMLEIIKGVTGSM